jgi:hypothetical protein
MCEMIATIDWQTVLASVGTSTVAACAIGWLLRTFISHELTKALEEHRQALQLHAQVQHIQFSRLHERRATVIHEVYKRIVQIRLMCHTVINFPNNTRQDGKAGEEIFEAIVKMNVYVGENALYLPKSITDKYTHMFTKGISKPLVAVGIADMLDNNFADAPPNRVTAIREVLLPHLKDNLTDFDALLNDLDLEFRVLLGAQ